MAPDLYTVEQLLCLTDFQIAEGARHHRTSHLLSRNQHRARGMGVRDAAQQQAREAAAAAAADDD
jgi:hypothetical protein